MLFSSCQSVALYDVVQCIMLHDTQGMLSNAVSDIFEQIDVDINSIIRKALKQWHSHISRFCSL